MTCDNHIVILTNGKDVARHLRFVRRGFVIVRNRPSNAISPHVNTLLIYFERHPKGRILTHSEILDGLINPCNLFVAV